MDLEKSLKQFVEKDDTETKPEGNKDQPQASASKKVEGGVEDVATAKKSKKIESGLFKPIDPPNLGNLFKPKDKDNDEESKPNILDVFKPKDNDNAKPNIFDALKPQDDKKPKPNLFDALKPKKDAPNLLDTLGKVAKNPLDVQGNLKHVQTLAKSIDENNKKIIATLPDPLNVRKKLEDVEKGFKDKGVKGGLDAIQKNLQQILRDLLVLLSENKEIDVSPKTILGVLLKNEKNDKEKLAEAISQNIFWPIRTIFSLPKY